MMAIITIIESEHELTFFKCFLKWTEAKRHGLIMITDKPSIYLKAKSQFAIDAVLLKRKNGDGVVEELHNTVEVIIDKMTIADAEIIYHSMWYSVLSMMNKYPDSLLCAWGGNTIASRVLKNIAKRYSLPILFFDNGNYPGKLFVDTQGTNRESFIYHHLSILNTLNQGNDDTVKIQKRNAIQFTKNTNYMFLMDILFSLFWRLPFRGNRNLITKLRYYRKPYHHRFIVPFDIANSRYYFIALSHSYEIKKLKLNNETLVEKIAGIELQAKMIGLDVVLKFHPRENDREFVDSIVQTISTTTTKIVDLNGGDLVKNADKIYLCNTSLAIEAIINGKTCEYIVSSFYENFNIDLLKRYISGYLISMELDEEGYFSTETMDHIWQQLEYQ